MANSLKSSAAHNTRVGALGLFVPMVKFRYVSAIFIKCLNDYLLQLTFENKEVRCADLRYLTEKGGVFEPFKDVEFFKKVAVDETGYTICWPNNVDLCPDKLWDISTPVKKTA